MEIDDSNWPELADRLAPLDMEPDELRALVELNLLPEGSVSSALEGGDIGVPIVFSWEHLYPYG